MVKCVYWGENRADEMYLDVGCVIGHCVCPDNAKCADYREPQPKIKP